MSRNAAIYREVTRAAALGLAVNLLLGAVKLVGGVVGNSFALIADAVNSIGDVVTTLVVLFALRVAQRPPDAEHPYGHTRAEAIAASNVALLVVVSALAVGWEALRRLTTPHGVPPVWTLWIAGGNILVKEALYQYKVRVGRRTGSAAIVANAWDHRSDALCALAVLVGLAAVRFGGPRFMWADEAASLVVVAAIVWTGCQLFRAAASELMDVQADPEFVDRVRTAALAVAGVRDVETLWVRKSGLEFFADIHVEVDPHLTVAAGHRIGHRVKDRLLADFANLRDVLVHLEPLPEPPPDTPPDTPPRPSPPPAAQQRPATPPPATPEPAPVAPPPPAVSPPPAASVPDPATVPAEPVAYDDFARVELRVGRITAVDDFPRARKPAYRLTIDFGPDLGTRRSSAQATDYAKDELLGRKVVAVVNLPPRNVAGFLSQVLVLGATASGTLALLSVDDHAPLGARVH